LPVTIWGIVRGDSSKDNSLARKTGNDNLNPILRLLVFIGKPFYKILFILLNIVVFLVYITGYLVRNLFSLFLKFTALLIIKLPSLITSLLHFVHDKANNIFRRKMKKSGIIFSAKKSRQKTITQRLIKFILSKLPKTKKPTSVLKKGKTRIQTAIDFLKFVLYMLRKFIASLNIRTNLIIFYLRLKLKLPALRPRIPSEKIKLPSLPQIRISKLRLVAYLFIFLFTLGMLAGGLFWQFVLRDLPSPEELTQRNVQASTKIYDRNGVLLYNIYKNENRTPVKLNDIPVNVRAATIAIEDAEFYEHIGFSVRGITRAFIKDIRNGELYGGSTITQQLVKNALLSPEKTVVRKLKELTLAIEVELTYSKSEILEMYLNEVSYGGTAYGVQEAAQTYFNKDVADLTLAEAALLAGLPKSPTQYSPFGTNRTAAIARQKEVLRQMQANGFITEDQRKNAENEDLHFAQNKTDIKAPHFVMYVREQLEDKYGKELVEKGGLQVRTTLDYQIQKLAEQVVADEIDKLKALNVSNAAVVVMNPKTGEILAMVGSYNYFDYENDGNVNVALSLRQPGSSIKVVNYAWALSHDLTAASMVNDSPVTFVVDGQPPYTPKNYEGGYRGNLTIRSAFAESRNIPAVKVLASYGVKNMLEMGKTMGITTWNNPDNYGLSLTLGGGEVKLVDLASAYSTVANYGKRPNLTSVLDISDSNGKILEQFNCDTKEKPAIIAEVAASQSAQNILNTVNACNQEQVLDPRVAFILTDILKDNEARAPSFGYNSLLVIPNHPEVAVKTGTSNDLRDNLTVGYNQDYLVAVWVGNNDNTPMARVASGVTGASPIFNQVISALIANNTSKTWDLPAGLVQLPICPYTGTLACEGCPVKMEWFLDNNKPEKACSPEWFQNEDENTKENGNTNDNENPENDNNQKKNIIRIGNGNIKNRIKYLQ
jgi:1A family penicillin-binding protein